MVALIGRALWAVWYVQIAKVARPFGWTWRQELYGYRAAWRALRDIERLERVQRALEASDDQAVKGEVLQGLHLS